MTRLFLAITASLFLINTTAYAMLGLKFQPAETYKQKQIIEQAKQDGFDTELVLAPADLNNDAIDEYIVRPADTKSCPQKPLCPYKIIAFQDRTPIELGTFDAHKIQLSDKKTYGVRSIIVYNQPHNDYAHETAHWNPFSFRFEIP